MMKMKMVMRMMTMMMTMIANIHQAHSDTLCKIWN
jgi:hypothetical protein